MLAAGHRPDQFITFTRVRRAEIAIVAGIEEPGCQPHETLIAVYHELPTSTRISNRTPSASIGLRIEGG